MIQIVIDTLGGDNGPSIIVEAVLSFLNKHSDVRITAVGNKEDLKHLEGVCHIIEATDIVPVEAGPMEVIHMRNSSMMTAIRTLKEEQFDGVISCGSTGGYLSAATLTLKMIPGIKRAALVSGFPTQVSGKRTVVLDIGANNENSPEELVQFARMGRLYSKAVYALENPKVYLLSNGNEEEKGSPLVKQTHQLLKETNFPNFMGNIEANTALNGEADVVVCDGYTGNVFLKTNEGIIKMMGGMIKDMFNKNAWTKIGYLHVKGEMKKMKESLDYKAVGGAMLLGVNGVVVKAHGNSDAYAFENAIELTYKLAKANVIEQIKEGLC